MTSDLVDIGRLNTGEAAGLDHNSSTPLVGTVVCHLGRPVLVVSAR